MLNHSFARFTNYMQVLIWVTKIGLIKIKYSQMLFEAETRRRHVDRESESKNIIADKVFNEKFMSKHN